MASYKTCGHQVYSDMSTGLKLQSVLSSSNTSKFAVEDSHRVDIIPKPPNCTLCASDTDIQSRQYEPHLNTLARTHPLISADAFLHYWQCHSRERSLQRTQWLNRLPKKLDRKLEDVRRVTPTDDDVLGWGILVIEGLNKALVTLSRKIPPCQGVRDPLPVLIYRGFLPINLQLRRASKNSDSAS